MENRRILAYLNTKNENYFVEINKTKNTRGGFNFSNPRCLGNPKCLLKIGDYHIAVLCNDVLMKKIVSELNPLCAAKYHNDAEDCMKSRFLSPFLDLFDENCEFDGMIVNDGMYNYWITADLKLFPLNGSGVIADKKEDAIVTRAVISTMRLGGLEGKEQLDTLGKSISEIWVYDMVNFSSMELK